MSGSTSFIALFKNVTPAMQTMFNTIRIRVPGITDEQLQIEVMEAARLFFSESTAWRDTREFNITALAYQVTLQNWAPGAEVLFPLFASWAGINLMPTNDITDFTQAQTGLPQVVTWDLSKRLTFAPKPLVGDVLRVSVVLQPALLNPVIPDTQISAWFEGLLDTVLGRIYGIPAKPWSSAALALLHMKKSRSWINKARDAANRGFARGETRWTFPYFARGSGGSLYGYGWGSSG